MRVFKTASVIVLVMLTLVMSIQPSAAMVIYPWCANYGGGGRGDTEPAVAGPRPSSNVWRRSGATEEPAVQIRGMCRILPRRPMLHRCGDDPLRHTNRVNRKAPTGPPMTLGNMREQGVNHLIA
jgi:hypothetical protein